MRVEDVEAVIATLPEVTEATSYGNRAWSVGKHHFAWIRPFSKADIKRFGDETPPSGPILAVRVDDLGEKEAVLAAGHRGFFTIPHFDGYAALLIDLDVAGKRAVREVIVDAWLSVAPASLARSFLDR